MMTQTFSQIKSLRVIQLLAEAIWRDYPRWRNTLLQLNAWIWILPRILRICQLKTYDLSLFSIKRI